MKHILGSEHASFFIIFWRYTFNELGSFLSHYDAMESVNTQTTPYGCHPYAVSRIFTVFLRNLLSKFYCQFSLTSKGICLTREWRKSERTYYMMLAIFSDFRSQNVTDWLAFGLTFGHSLSENRSEGHTAFEWPSRTLLRVVLKSSRSKLSVETLKSKIGWYTAKLQH